MKNEKSNQFPELVFEISWEVCNKVGGIHTVLTSRSPEMIKALNDQYIVIGPDIWREEHSNPEFIEQPDLHRGWKNFAHDQGIFVRVGRWNIPGQPIAIIVDFTPLIAQKNEIFSRAWENFHLDSISGHWDYVEAALFGYASGMVIKSFSEYYRYTRSLAHFHEWMTGMGVLYLKNEAPYIATVFTTHATTTGRSLAGNGYDLYEELANFNGDEMASRLGVKAKHSLEKSAAHNSSVFTTVSEVTSKECAQFLEKEVDIITPNGFSNKIFKEISSDLNRQESRSKLLKIGEAVVGFHLDENAVLLGTSGRYEFKNKGIDQFIQLMSMLNADSSSAKSFLAFIFVPANNYGPRQSVLQRLAGSETENSGSPYLTHNLHNSHDDQILNALISSGLKNEKGNKVHVVFVPAYLNGQDGVLNMHYYDALKGLDVTLFPSYYEPWGYTPMESVFMGVPTITTNLSGFGQWIVNHVEPKKSIITSVVTRKELNNDKFLNDLYNQLQFFVNDIVDNKDQLNESADYIVQTTSWESFVKNYWDAYRMAMSVADIEVKPVFEQLSEPKDQEVQDFLSKTPPVWKDIIIESYIPPAFSGLEQISRNIWWTWNSPAERLFRMMDPLLWEEVEHNPIKLLRQVSLERLQELDHDSVFKELYTKVSDSFTQYISQELHDSPNIAYFSMEFGFHASLKIYSGGLGILAGDYLKEASDRRVAMTGIGLLYRHGYFKQILTLAGDQIADNIAEEFSNLPLELVKDEQDEPLSIQVAFPGRIVLARIWLVKVGRINLYLLDTDVEGNQPADRNITSNLYGGDEENRLKQEMILGVAGIRMLKLLGIHPHIYHCNEGHAAFIGLERIRQFMEIQKFTFRESLEAVRASTLFTTHTPVPAGHDSFSEDLVRTYMGHYPSRLNISWLEFIGLGRLHPNDGNERFSMSYLAARLSQEINGVSNLHGEVTRNMFKYLWSGYFSEELHIGSVTNGVHYQTWTAEVWQDLYEATFGPGFLDNQANGQYWEKISQVPAEELWKIKEHLRKELISYIKHRLEKVSIRQHEPPKQVIEIVQKLNDKVLTIGFARRFATYKRAHLLFKDLERLGQIVNHPERPVQFVFAGKAHPRDKAGQDLIKYIVEVSRQPQFRGRIIFLENYDMTVARKLVQGVDVWLNTPTRPLEASGTSGMKATMNGVMNLSVLDGWWCEGYRADAGWALPQEKIYQDQNFQDELDGASLYNILEESIIPLFYSRDKAGIPQGWISMMRNTIAHIAPRFTTRRMLDDYFDRYYRILLKRTLAVTKDNYHMAREISRWKTRVTRLWQDIEVIEVKYSKNLNQPLRMGEVYTSEVVLKLNGLTPDEVGVELVVISEDEKGDQSFVFNQEYTRTLIQNGHVHYKLGTIPTQPGLYKYGIRLFPKHDFLPNKQDFLLIRWI